MAITHTKLGRTTQLFLNHIDWPSPLQLLLVVQYIVVIVASSLLCRGIRPNLFGQEAQGLEWLPCPHTLLLAIGQGLFADLAHHEQIWWQSPFKFLLLPPSRFLDPKRYCIQCVQNGEYSGGTESFVVISRQKQHLRPHCGTICKCELYCLSKRSRHFITQQVITFHTF